MAIKDFEFFTKTKGQVPSVVTELPNLADVQDNVEVSFQGRRRIANKTAGVWEYVGYSEDTGNPIYDFIKAQDAATLGTAEGYADGVGTAAVNTSKAYTDAKVVGLFDPRGSWDASGNVYPSTGGSGTEGAIVKGDAFRISVAGKLSGKSVKVGYWVVALVDTPAQVEANWDIWETAATDLWNCEYFVSATNGSNYKGDGTKEHQLKTLQYAIDKDGISSSHKVIYFDAQCTENLMFGPGISPFWSNRGNYDASGNTFPATGGSGVDGAIVKNDAWTVNVAGTLGGIAVVSVDIVLALANAPGQTAENWYVRKNFAYNQNVTIVGVGVLDSQKSNIVGNHYATGSSTTRFRVLNSILTAGVDDYVLTFNGTAGRHYFQNASIMPGASKKAVKATGANARWHEFYDCYVGGSVDCESSTATMSMKFTRQLAGEFKLNMTNFCTVNVYDCQRYDQINHPAGKLYVNGLLESYRITDNQGIVSTAVIPLEPPLNIPYLEIINAKMRNTANNWMLINKTGDCSFLLDGVVRDVVNDVLTGTRIYGTRATDISADHTAVNYSVANEGLPAHLAGIDTKLGDLAPEGKEISVATGDWTAVTGGYELTIAAATHGVANVALAGFWEAVTEGEETWYKLQHGIVPFIKANGDLYFFIISTVAGKVKVMGV